MVNIEHVARSNNKAAGHTGSDVAAGLRRRDTIRRAWMLKDSWLLLVGHDPWLFVGRQTLGGWKGKLK